jgi:hypothetical protein
MGILAKALEAPSAYSVKRDQPGLWADLIDRIDGAIVPAQLDEFEAWLEQRPLDLPGAWNSPLRDRIERRREELAEEDIGYILRDRFDF